MEMESNQALARVQLGRNSEFVNEDFSILLVDGTFDKIHILKKRLLLFL